MHAHTALAEARAYAVEQSSDPDTKVGVLLEVLRHNDGTLHKLFGTNRLPCGLEELPVGDKGLFIEHAERDAIYNAASRGHSTRKATMYCTWFPCADCARAIVQAGIATLVCGARRDTKHPRWGVSWDAAQLILDAGNVSVLYTD